MAPGKLRNFQDSVKDEELNSVSIRRPLKPNESNFCEFAVAKDHLDIFPPVMAKPQPLKVAVIGAGVAGLNTARELKKDGHQVVVFEKSDRIGGIWVYTPEVENDPLGLVPDRKVVHSSLYASLRTNVPGILMGFSDYPFRVGKSWYNDYPGHADVLQFLNDFARDFGLLESIRFKTEVIRVEQTLPSDGHDSDRWVVESRTSRNDGIIMNSVELFEAVVICNGHYTQPRLGEFAGIEKWPGKQIHSHNYRVPEPFRGQVVVMVGLGPSTFDISVEIASVAKEVHVSIRTPRIEKAFKMGINNLWLHSQINYCSENGDITFQDGSSVHLVDIIVHCTGYSYNFPFLRTNGSVSIDDNRVGPLYKHVFPPQLAPRLSFVGIPHRSINFSMLEYQAKWVAHVLAGKTILPSKEEMLADVEKLYRDMELTGVPKHHTHTLPLDRVDEYLNFLRAQIGQSPVDKRVVEIFGINAKEMGTCWVGYRERARHLFPINIMD